MRPYRLPVRRHAPRLWRQEGFLKATVDLALKRKDFNGEFRKYLLERLGEDPEIPDKQTEQEIVEPELLDIVGINSE